MVFFMGILAFSICDGSFALFLCVIYMDFPAVKCSSFFSFYSANFMALMIGCRYSGGTIRLCYFLRTDPTFIIMLNRILWHHRSDAQRGARIISFDSVTLTWEGFCLF